MNHMKSARVSFVSRLFKVHDFDFLNAHPPLYRFFEIIPGALVWFTLLSGILLSFIKPIWAIGFIIVFDLLWLVRVFYLTLHLLISYRKYRKEISIDWAQRIKELKGSESIWHLIFIPTYKEDLSVLTSTFEGLKRAQYPRERMMVVLAGEERDRMKFERNAAEILKGYGNAFGALIVTLHPRDLPGEVAGKGANINWAATQALNHINKNRIKIDDVIVSSFDVDTVVHPNYFSALAYYYLKHPARTRTSFQPVPLYNNNIWDAPALMRVVANSTTFWLMSEQTRPERLFTFSSHSMSLRALVDVGFWQKDIVTEDSRIFLQCFFKYDGDYTVTPFHMPVSMDTVLGKNLWRSLVNQYKQQRRWAWGIEHFPYMIWRFIQSPRIPLGEKLRKLWILLEGMYSWATAPVLILVLGWLPLQVAKYTAPSEHATVIAQNAPIVLETIMRVALVGIFVAAILSTILLPPRTHHTSKIRYFFVIIQWILFPVTMIMFGSLAAIDAQTRLMFGRYLGFTVTEKARSSTPLDKRDV